MANFYQTIKRIQNLTSDPNLTEDQQQFFGKLLNVSTFNNLTEELSVKRLEVKDNDLGAIPVSKSDISSMIKRVKLELNAQPFFENFTYKKHLKEVLASLEGSHEKMISVVAARRLSFTKPYVLWLDHSIQKGPK